MKGTLFIISLRIILCLLKMLMKYKTESFFLII